MNKAILNNKVQDYIKNYSEDVTALALTGSKFKNIETTELIQQIESYRRAKNKLPTWYNSDGILYPPKLNLEQTSSEITANYKSSLVVGNTLADITGGFGVDSYYFAKQFRNVHHFEINEQLSEIASHNYKQLGVQNIKCIAKNGLQQVLKSVYDVIYADPSRRHDAKGKVFFLKDCIPNMPVNLPRLLDHSPTILIKTSPMLDISVALKELNHVYQIHIVAVNNEVKELLWLIKRGWREDPLIKTINITRNTSEKFEFYMNQTVQVIYGGPERFLYEPNAALMKSGGFDVISEAYKVKKLHRHSHLYTGSLLRDFPGRRFSIDKVVPYNKSSMRTGITFDKANISIRNFPESVEKIRKKWKLKDGGDRYLFFTTLENDQKTMLICSKL